MVTYPMDHSQSILMIILEELFKVIMLAVIHVQVHNISQYYQINICIVMVQINFQYLIYKTTHINSI